MEGMELEAALTRPPAHPPICMCGGGIYSSMHSFALVQKQQTANFLVGLGLNWSPVATWFLC